MKFVLMVIWLNGWGVPLQATTTQTFFESVELCHQAARQLPSTATGICMQVSN